MDSPRRVLSWDPTNLSVDRFQYCEWGRWVWWLLSRFHVLCRSSYRANSTAGSHLMSGNYTVSGYLASAQLKDIYIKYSLIWSSEITAAMEGTGRQYDFHYSQISTNRAEPWGRLRCPGLHMYLHVRYHTCQELPGDLCWGWLGLGTRLGMHQDSFSLPPVSIIETIHVDTYTLDQGPTDIKGRSTVHRAPCCSPSCTFFRCLRIWGRKKVNCLLVKGDLFARVTISTHRNWERLVDTRLTRSDTLLYILYYNILAGTYHVLHV